MYIRLEINDVFAFSCPPSRAQLGVTLLFVNGTSATLDGALTVKLTKVRIAARVRVCRSTAFFCLVVGRMMTFVFVCNTVDADHESHRVSRRHAVHFVLPDLRLPFEKTSTGVATAIILSCLCNIKPCNPH
jgi:hypothetical protein